MNNNQTQPAEDERVKEIRERRKLVDIVGTDHDQVLDAYRADVDYLLSLLPVQPAARCENCEHTNPHDGPAGDINDACTHPCCNCAYDSRPAASTPTDDKDELHFEVLFPRGVDRAIIEKSVRALFRNTRELEVRIDSLAQSAFDTIDEVQHRADEVVNAAIEWHQSGREGDNTWFDKAEALGAAIDRLLELRQPATACTCLLKANDGTPLRGYHDDSCPAAASTEAQDDRETVICPVCKNEVPEDSMLSYNNTPNAFCQQCVDSGRV